jgi:hypothetical protein
MAAMSNAGASGLRAMFFSKDSAITESLDHYAEKENRQKHNKRVLYDLSLITRALKKTNCLASLRQAG